MPAFGDVNTPADQLIWRQLIEKEMDMRARAPRSGFSLRCAVNREEVPVRFKPGHIDPSQAKICKGFDPKAYGWDPQGELATEFRRCRKRSTAPPTRRFLFPETTAQENGWCQKVAKENLAKVIPPPAVSTSAGAGGRVQAKADGEQSEKVVKLPDVSAQRRARRKERDEDEEKDADEGEPKPKRSLGKWASDSQLSAAMPSKLGTELSAAAPSCLSSAIFTDLSKTSSYPGVAKELVRRVRAQDEAVEKAMVEYRRYLSYGDRGNKHFYPLGETDATAYANAFTKATSGVPPHKWNPRA